MSTAQVAVSNPLITYWQKLQERERWLVALALVLVSAAALWFLAIRPAWQQLQQAPVRLDELDSQTLVMRRLAAETRELRSAPQVNPAQALASLRAASGRLGNNAKLSVRGDRAVLTIDGITGEALRAWLSEVRSGARARAVEAQLTNANNGFSGTITLSLAGVP
jgi:general secretion pathway protein M